MTAHKTLSAIAALVIGLQSAMTFAHEKMEPEKKTDKQDCAAFMETGDSKMDMKDSMMQAMMKKCQAEMNHGSGQVPQTDKDSSTTKEDHSGEH